MHRFDGQSPDIRSKKPTAKKIFKCHARVEVTLLFINESILIAFVLACFWDIPVSILRLTLL